jgi:hypothetical protein
MRALTEFGIRAFAFYNTPTLQYSSTPKQFANFSGNPARAGMTWT